MSKYTTEVRFICERSAGLSESVGYSSIETVLDASREKVFDFDYPIFDEAYRATLEKKILKHYYTREICCETVGLWKLFLNCKMNEIMPYYNQLYKSALIEFNPLYDVDLTTDYHKVGDGNNEKSRAVVEDASYSENKTSEFNEDDVYGENKVHTNINTLDENSRGSESKATNQSSNDSTESKTENTPTNKNDHWEYFSDTPEGGINGVADLSYLTNATHVTDDSTGSKVVTETDSSTGNTSETLSNGEIVNDKNAITNENGNVDTNSARNRNGGDTTNSAGDNTKTINENNAETIKNIEDYLQHVVGKRGSMSYSKMLEEFRKTFLNIDMLVINDLRDLFMNLW